MKNTIGIEENEIHNTEEEIIEEGEVNEFGSILPFVFWRSTEIRKQEMRDRLDRLDPKGVQEYLARHLDYIIETSIVEWGSKNLQVAMKWIEHISKLMWYTETNQSYTIKSNIPVVSWEDANKW